MLPVRLSPYGQMLLRKSRCPSSKVRFTVGEIVPEEGREIDEPEKHFEQKGTKKTKE